MNLTDQDIQAIVLALNKQQSTHACAFSAEEVQFVRNWLDTMKTAKSELVRWLIRMIIVGLGIIAAISVAFKLGFFKVN